MANQVIKLISARHHGRASLEEVLSRRRSRRRYRRKAISFNDFSQLLWAGQGVNNSRDGGRTAPSAGALFPLELYCVVGQIDRLEPGVYKHQVKGHKLKRISHGDVLKQLAAVALEQEWLERAGVVFVFAAVKWRTRQKYGNDSSRYIMIEVGHVAQNILLQAESLGLAAAVVGAFYPTQMKRLLKMPKSETPLYILSVGAK